MIDISVSVSPDRDDQRHKAGTLPAAEIVRQIALQREVVASLTRRVAMEAGEIRRLQWVLESRVKHDKHVEEQIIRELAEYDLSREGMDGNE